MRRMHGARQQYDLVTAAYVLSELDSDRERQQVIQELWERTKGMLVLVEPGTPSGYENIISAREQVRACQACWLLRLLRYTLPKIRA